MTISLKVRTDYSAGAHQSVGTGTVLRRENLEHIGCRAQWIVQEAFGIHRDALSLRFLKFSRSSRHVGLVFILKPDGWFPL